MKYVCDVCGWIYDEEEGAPDMGIAPGTKFEDLPEDLQNYYLNHNLHTNSFALILLSTTICASATSPNTECFWG